MAKPKTVFACQSCGYQSPRWLGKCPDCNSWNSFAEEDYQAPAGSREARPGGHAYSEKPVLLTEVSAEESSRVKTRIGELDRVLGGGIVPGSVVLIGGDPGIGKSTISLQIANNLTSGGAKVLYASAEESVSQTKLRAQRLGADKSGELYIVNQTDLSQILGYVAKLKPQVVFVDSIQVVFDPAFTSSSGSVSQVRECAAALTHMAKATGTAVFIIGHVTKEGTLAGPRVLEHIVDTVLYFEGDRFSSYRILRAVKNRFGSTNEIGIFEMGSQGLEEVKNPSEIFLAEKPQGVSGSVVSAVLEGGRSLLVEVQALVSKSGIGFARRKSEGFDYNRLALLVAVLEKRMGLALENEDIFVNIVGGIKVEDPAADLAVCAAVASAFRDKPLPADTAIVGEVGLAGEVRSISQVALRINEAHKLGFKNIIVPKHAVKGAPDAMKGMTVTPVSTLKEAFDVLFI